MRKDVPYLANVKADINPAGPAPMMMTSTSMFLSSMVIVSLVRTPSAEGFHISIHAGEECFAAGFVVGSVPTQSTGGKFVENEFPATRECK
jgi:hypothetical protein